MNIQPVSALSVPIGKLRPGGGIASTPAPVRQVPIKTAPKKPITKPSTGKRPTIRMPSQKMPAGPKAPPKPDPINQYLTNNTTYQSQLSAIQKALGDYQANELQQENSYNSGYALNRSNLQDQQRITGIDQAEDFGGRGMLRSGLYAVDNTNRLNDFANQFSQLDQARADYLMNARQGLSNYRTSQQLAQQQARQDAINRRAIGLIGGGNPVIQ